MSLSSASTCRVNMERWRPALLQPGRGNLHQRPRERCGGEKRLLQQVREPQHSRAGDAGDAACKTSALQSTCQSLTHGLAKVFACYCLHSAVGISVHPPSKEGRIEASPCGPQCGQSPADLCLPTSAVTEPPLSKNLVWRRSTLTAYKSQCR